jgi:hypothetical protein
MECAHGDPKIAGYLALRLPGIDPFEQGIVVPRNDLR